MASSDVKLDSLNGITVKIILTRSLTWRMWIAIQLHKLAIRLVGADVCVEAAND